MAAYNDPVASLGGSIIVRLWSLDHAYTAHLSCIVHREGLVILDKASYCGPVWTVRPVRYLYGPVYIDAVIVFVCDVHISWSRYNRKERKLQDGLQTCTVNCVDPVQHACQMTAWSGPDQGSREFLSIKILRLATWELLGWWSVVVMCNCLITEDSCRPAFRIREWKQSYPTYDGSYLT